MFKLLGVIGVALYLVKLSGFCFSQFEWKSNTELIEAGFGYEIAGGWGNTPNVPDIEAYLRDYPGCCSVRNADDGTFINALFGRRFYRVAIKYPVKDTTANDGQPFYESILIMDCCGKDVPDRFGMPFSTPIPAGPLVTSRRALADQP